MEEKQPIDLVSLSKPIDTYLVQLDERGRLVLPSSIRNILALQPKDKLVASLEGNALRLTTVKSQVANAKGILSKISPERSLSEELIKERRQEVERE